MEFCISQQNANRQIPKFCNHCSLLPSLFSCVEVWLSAVLSIMVGKETTAFFEFQKRNERGKIEWMHKGTLHRNDAKSHSNTFRCYYEATLNMLHMCWKIVMRKLYSSIHLLPIHSLTFPWIVELFRKKMINLSSPHSIWKTGGILISKSHFNCC